MPEVTVDTTPVQLLPANYRRQTVYIRNNSTAGQIVFVVKARPEGLAIANAQFVLGPGEAISQNVTFDGPDVRLPWSAVSNLAGADVYASDQPAHIAEQEALGA